MASASAPVVRLDAGGFEEAGDSIVVRRSARDADGDSLTCDVALAHDGGRRTEPLAAAVTRDTRHAVPAARGSSFRAGGRVFPRARAGSGKDGVLAGGRQHWPSDAQGALGEGAEVLAALDAGAIDHLLPHGDGFTGGADRARSGGLPPCPPAERAARPHRRPGLHGPHLSAG